MEKRSERIETGKLVRKNRMGKTGDEEKKRDK